MVHRDRRVGVGLLKTLLERLIKARSRHGDDFRLGPASGVGSKFVQIASLAIISVYTPTEGMGIEMEAICPRSMFQFASDTWRRSCRGSIWRRVKYDTSIAELAKMDQAHKLRTSRWKKLTTRR